MNITLLLGITDTKSLSADVEILVRAAMKTNSPHSTRYVQS